MSVRALLVALSAEVVAFGMLAVVIVDLRNLELSFDGLHLTSQGDQVLAESLMPPLNALLDRW